MGKEIATRKKKNRDEYMNHCTNLFGLLMEGYPAQESSTPIK